MSGPRISYVEPQDIKDPEMLKELERCASSGTPRPESQSIRAHVPAIFFGFAKVWRDAFYDGVLDNAVKELYPFAGRAGGAARRMVSSLQ